MQPRMYWYLHVFSLFATFTQAHKLSGLLFPYLEPITEAEVFAPLTWLADVVGFDTSSHFLRANEQWNFDVLPPYGILSDSNIDVTVYGWAHEVVEPYIKDRDKDIDLVLFRATIEPASPVRAWFRETFFGPHYLLNQSEANIARKRIVPFLSPTLRDMQFQIFLQRPCDEYRPPVFKTNVNGRFRHRFQIPESCIDSSSLPTGLGFQARHVPIELRPLGPHRAPSEPITTNVTLLSKTGMTIVADVDDILRISEIWNMKQAVLSTIARPFEVWQNMGDIFASWSTIPGISFHYLTDTPDLLQRWYVEGMQTMGFPQGSFDTRAWNFSQTVPAMPSRKESLDRLLSALPHRKFVLVGDTSNADVPSVYAQAMERYPDRVECILVRDTQATEPSDYRIAPTNDYLDLPEDRYFFFRNSDDLKHVALVSPPPRPDAAQESDDSQSRNPIVQPGGCFGYVQDPERGDVHRVMPKSSLVPSLARPSLLDAKSNLRALGWRVMCDLCMKWRPNRLCKFDWRKAEVADKGDEIWDGETGRWVRKSGPVQDETGGAATGASP